MCDHEKTPRFYLEHTSGVAVTDGDIIADMQRVASAYGDGALPVRLYQSHGQYSNTTASKRFGSWNTAVKAAGLQVLNEFDVPDEELFANVEQVWLALGKQPRKRDLTPLLSRYSERPYARRFGSWRQSLESFIQWANTIAGSPAPVALQPNARRTARDPNSALRWRVANRDSFRCQHCGKSPAVHAGVRLHIDHIVPWSDGGETVLDNLQTLCSDCNPGKGTQKQTDG